MGGLQQLAQWATVGKPKATGVDTWDRQIEYRDRSLKRDPDSFSQAWQLPPQVTKLQRPLHLASLLCNFTDVGDGDGAHPIRASAEIMTRERSADIHDNIAAAAGSAPYEMLVRDASAAVLHQSWRTEKPGMLRARCTLCHSDDCSCLPIGSSIMLLQR